MRERLATNMLVQDSRQPMLPQTMTLPRVKILSLLQMILLNSVVCGVEICACAGFTYIPPMLLKAGYTEENMSIILGMGPLLGFFLVPVIGRASDHCKSSYGRRRPFILALSVLLIMSLLLIPYGEYFSDLAFGKSAISKSLGLLSLTVGVVMLDFTSQACLTPCEALLSDAAKGTDQQEKIFSIYSLMVSTGGFIGYLVTALDWSTTPVGVYFGNQERSVFTMLVAFFIVMLMATVMVAEEQPINFRGSESFLPDEPIETTISMGNGCLESGYETSSNSSEEGIPAMKAKGLNNAHTLKSRTSPSRRQQMRPRLSFQIFNSVCRIPFLWRAKSWFSNWCSLIWVSIYQRLPDSIQNMTNIPFVLRRLALANFCSWTAVMGFNLFFTDFVGQAVYHGNPNAPENSPLRNLYDEGVRMGSWGLLLHCIMSASYAFFIEKIVDRYGCRQTYFAGMVAFCLSMFGMVMFRNIVFVIIMSATTGFAYATLTTIPFILVSVYHSDKELFFFDALPKMSTNGGPSQSPTRGIATDMGTLDSAYFLSQVVLSGLMGYVVHITGTVMSYMVTAGLMGVLACFFVQSIIIDKQDIVKHISKERQRRSTIRL